MNKSMLLLLLPFALTANHVYNGSLELGTDGFAIEKNLRTDTNPGLQFLPLKTAEAAPGEGKNSLLIENPYAENFSLFSKEFQLKANTEYQLSVKVKSSIPQDKIVLGVFKVAPGWFVKIRSFPVSSEWKTLQYTFRSDRKDGWYHIQVRPGSEQNPNASNLMFDAFMLVEKEKTAVLHPEAAVTVDKKLYLRGESARIELKVTNRTNAPFAEKVTVTGRDEYTGSLCFSETLPVSLAAGETKQFALKPQPLNRYAAVRVSASGKNLRTHDAFFCTIGKYEAKPFDINRDFVVGVNGGMQYVMPPQSKAPAYLVRNAPMEHYFELLSAVGCRVLRDHDAGVRGVNWPAVEWNRGKFDFSALDRQLAMYDKFNMVLYPVIGNGFKENYKYWESQSWPLWVVPLSERVKDDPPYVMKHVRGHILLPPLELYRNYIFQIAKHAKGRIPVYEIINEPSLYLSPENYMRYMTTAASAIREADPAAKITGACLTSDFGHDSSPWMYKCIELGILKSVDSFSTHPYRSRELGSVRPADRELEKLRKVLKSFRRPQLQIWNTELYYLADNGAKYDSFEDGLFSAHHVVWRFLVDLGEGATQSLSAHSNGLWKRLLTPNMQHGSASVHELIPSENMLAYNAMARLFERAERVAKFRYPNGIICYVFRKDGKLIAAVWNYQKKKGIHADLSTFEVMDLFGNPEKAEEKLLGNAPFYLTPGKLSGKEFLSRLEKLPVRLDQPLFPGEIARKVGSTLYVMLHNGSAQEQSGTLGLNGGGITARSPYAFTIPANGKLSIELPVKTIKPDGKEPMLMLYLDSTLTAIPVKIVENKLIGRSFEMKNANGTIAFGNGKITLKMNVKDVTDAGASGKRTPWETDCVELFFDLAPHVLASELAQAYTPETFRLFVTPRDAKKLHGMGAVKVSDCKLDVKQDANGYSFTLEIPAETGNMLGFDVKIDDVDGKKMTETMLGNGEKLYENRCNFSIVK